LAERRRRRPGQAPQSEPGGLLPTCRGLAAGRRRRSHEVAEVTAAWYSVPRGAEMLVRAGHHLRARRSFAGAAPASQHGRWPGSAGPRFRISRGL